MSVLRRASRSPVTKAAVPSFDPLTRISEHFVLADFLGNQTVYSKGHVNSFARDKASLDKMDNLKALANHALEPILAAYGALSISYGYISPALSESIIKYQDPKKPSHHRFDLGAAVDICVHEWVQGLRGPAIEDLYLPESVRGAPIGLAHCLDMDGIPYSRLITYSESPYLCLAVSSTEVYRDQPRKAFYENRYQGHKGAKPEYIQLSNQGARNRHFAQLQELGLEVDWHGHGYPTYHGGGYCQYQHRRVSRYTMVSDWLLDLQSIANGSKNIPALNDERVLDSFAAAGIVYDFMIGGLGFKRLSIVGGYVCPMNPSFDPANDWTTNEVSFDIVGPESLPQNALQQMLVQLPSGAYAEEITKGRIRIRLLVAEVLENPEFDLTKL